MSGEAPSRLSGLQAANEAREEARTARMVLLADFANEARNCAGLNAGWRTGPGLSSKEIAREFVKRHPLSPEKSGFAAALRMLTELEQGGLVRKKL
jgi:hypothetical protein